MTDGTPVTRGALGRFGFPEPREMSCLSRSLIMIGMRMRRTPMRLMRRCVERLESAGFPLPVEQLEVRSLAGGVERTVDAYILTHG